MYYTGAQKGCRLEGPKSGPKMGPVFSKKKNEPVFEKMNQNAKRSQVELDSHASKSPTKAASPFMDCKAIHGRRLGSPNTQNH